MPFSIKHSQGPPCLLSRIFNNSFLSVIELMVLARSEGFNPLLSTESLGAPLYNKTLTGLVDDNYSALFTAKCIGEYPSISFIIKCSNLTQAKI